MAPAIPGAPASPGESAAIPSTLFGDGLFGDPLSDDLPADSPPESPFGADQSSFGFEEEESEGFSFFIEGTSSYALGLLSVGYLNSRVQEFSRSLSEEGKHHSDHRKIPQPQSQTDRFQGSNFQEKILYPARHRAKEDPEEGQITSCPSLPAS